ncbi:hypothetical protein ACFYRC_35125 [Streptomyces sp. NPDC005279]|uniref:hypothetical protein n=1 Tax=Streptomyces sp. NPDC005279 TaxID=3364712 RepID=UPI00368DF34F
MLLAGRTSQPGQGLERALYAVDPRDYTPTLLLRLPNTTSVTGLARADDGAVYLVTDIRGNEQAPERGEGRRPGARCARHPARRAAVALEPADGRLAQVAFKLCV